MMAGEGIEEEPGAPPKRVVSPKGEGGLVLAGPTPQVCVGTWQDGGPALIHVIT